ncbi:16700_t:CDS:2 [Funneliformis mosseae]|uniref:16700_t:CDS:1 n=1 Tax=Funneliformis mosseae TaxID=27381 RepID=A0A9N8VG12_FUNMO|nr:16700_t:CDS:2 [Funneliformis mosseae]
MSDICTAFDNYENVDKMDAHFSFYKTLSLINDDEKMSQETDVLKANYSFWNTSSPTSSSSHKGKKRKCLLKMVMGGQRWESNDHLAKDCENHPPLEN